MAEEHAIKNITAFVKIRGINRKHLNPLLTPEELDTLCDVYYDHIHHYQPTPKQLRFYPDYHQHLLGSYLALTPLSSSLKTSLQEQLNQLMENYPLNSNFKNLDEFFEQTD